jgi:hypothetical protein
MTDPHPHPFPRGEKREWGQQEGKGVQGQPLWPQKDTDMSPRTGPSGATEPQDQGRHGSHWQSLAPTMHPALSLHFGVTGPMRPLTSWVAGTVTLPGPQRRSSERCWLLSKVTTEDRLTEESSPEDLALNKTMYFSSHAVSCKHLRDQPTLAVRSTSLSLCSVSSAAPEPDSTPESPGFSNTEAGTLSRVPKCPRAF